MAAVHMTRGRVYGHLIRYTIPLVLGNLFQLLYNVMDSVIVGRFIGKEALAAAGTAGPVMNIVILGISGICVGAGVLMSEFFGAGEEEKLKREMTTTLLFGLAFSLAVVVFGWLAARPILRFIHVPRELMDMTSAYLRIIFLGTPFTYFYNALASSLKSIGDSATPLRFLMLSSVLNVVMDCVLIGLMGFGIVCSALTTVIAQGVSALLCMSHVYRKVPVLRIMRNGWRVDGALLKRTLQYGSVTALQSACQPLGKLLIQGAVNPMGVDVIAAFHAAERVDEFALLPERSLGQTMTTFVAQNRGAGKPERVREGFAKGLTLATGYGVCIGIGVWIAREPLMRLFASGGDAETLAACGTGYLSLMACFYLLPSVSNSVQGFFRGMGNMRMTLVCTFLQTSLRVCCTYLLTPSMGLRGIAVACAVGWTAMMIYELPCSLKEIQRFFSKKSEKDEKSA